jgi:hypothetical protein
MLGSGPLKIPYTQNNAQQLSGAKNNMINQKKHNTNHPSADSKVAAQQSDSQVSGGGKKSKSLE